MTCLTEYNEAETMQMFKDEAYRKGREEGIEAGIEEGKMQDAERMYTDGLSVSLISKYVDIPEQIVRKWLEG